MRLCLRSISSFRRFLLVKAISMPEKNADNNSIKIISMTEVSIVLFILGYSPASSACTARRRGWISPTGSAGRSSSSPSGRTAGAAKGGSSESGAAGCAATGAAGRSVAERGESEVRPAGSGTAVESDSLGLTSTSMRPFIRRKRQSLNSSSDSKPSPINTSRPSFCTIFESTFE